MTFSCRIQGSKCVKYNGPHKSKNHCEFGWCCKANDRINPPRLETKKGELCPHSFKCSNCWGDHQADSNQCPFWKHRFNREWQQKKYAEIHDNRSKSIRSEVNSEPQLWLWKISKFFCKMFTKTPSSSTPSLRPKTSWTLFSSKNLLGPKFIKSLVLLFAMENLLWELTIIQTGYRLPGFPWKGRTLQESLFTLTYVFLLYTFYSAKTLLITGISFSFLFLTITFAIISWMFTLILPILP